MASIADRDYFIFAVVLYGLSTLYSVLLWRRGFRQDNRLNYCLLLGAAGLHTVAMVQRGFTLSRCPVNNLYEATTFVAWTIVVSYLVVGLWSRLRFLGAFASPVLLAMGVFALMPGLDERGPVPDFSHGLESLHAAMILLAYGAFGLGSVAGAMYLTQEHDLKFRKLRAVFSLMPPIERLERVAGQMLLVGFVLLTLGLALGGYYLWQRNETFSGDLKIIWSALVWLIYGGLLVMRWGFAQGGRRFAWGAVGTFAFILLTFWGTNLASRIHQQ